MEQEEEVPRVALKICGNFISSGGRQRRQQSALLYAGPEFEWVLLGNKVDDNLHSHLAPSAEMLYDGRPSRLKNISCGWTTASACYPQKSVAAPEADAASVVYEYIFCITHTIAHAIYSRIQFNSMRKHAVGFATLSEERLALWFPERSWCSFFLNVC